MMKPLVQKLILLALSLVIISRASQAQEGQISTAELSFKELQTLFTLQNQLIYYLPDVGAVSEKMDEHILKLVKDFEQMVHADTIRLDVFGLEQDSSFFFNDEKLKTFLSEKDIYFNAHLKDLLQGMHSPYLDSLQRVLYQWRNLEEESRTKLIDEVNSGLVRFRDWLDDGYAQYLDAQKEYITGQGKAVANDLSHYSNVLILLNQLKPQLEQLIQPDLDSLRENIVTSFIQLRSEEGLVRTFTGFVSDPENAQVIRFLTGNDQEKLAQLKGLVMQYEEALEFPIALSDGEKIFKRGEASLDSLKTELRNHQAKLGQSLFELRKQLLEESLNALEKLVSEQKQALEGNLKDYWKQSELNKKFEEKVSDLKEQFQPYSDTDYLDFKLAANDPIWLRLRPLDDVNERLLKGDSLKQVSAEVSLILLPLKKRKTDLNFVDKYITIDARDKAKATEALNNYYFEVPLGLTVQELSLVKSIDGDFEAQVLEDNTNLNAFKVKVTLPEIGIWTRLKYDTEQLKAAARQMGFSEVLGVEIQKVKLDVSNWDVHFEMTWQPPGLLSELLAENSNLKKTNISLKELKGINDPSKDIRDRLATVVNQRIAQSVQRYIETNTEKLAPLLLSERIEQVSISGSRNSINGQFKVLPIGARQLGVTAPVDLYFRVAYENQRPVFELSKPKIDVSAYLRSYVRDSLLNFTELSNQVRDYGKSLNENSYVNLVTNLANAIEFEDFTVDVKNASICGNVRVPGNNAARVCLDRNGVNTSNLSQLLKASIEDFIRREFDKLVKDFTANLEAEAGRVFNNICEQWRNTELSFYGLTLPSGNLVKCENGVALVSTSYQVGSINLNLNARISTSGVKIDYDVKDQSALIQSIEDTVQSFFNQLEYFRFTNARIKEGQFKVDVRLALEVMDFDEHVAVIEVSPNGQIKVDDSLGGLNNALFITLNRKLARFLDDFIDDHDFRMEFGQDGEGLEIVEGTQVSLQDKRLSFKAKATLPFGIEIKDIQIVFDFDSGIPKVVLPSKDLLKRAILPRFELDFGEALQIDIQITDLETSPVAIVGDIDMAIPDLFSLPSTRFTLTQAGHSLELRPKVTLPFVVEIAPAVAAVRPSIELITDEKICRLKSKITLGITEEANITEKLIRVNAKMDFDYKNLGDASYTGTAYLLHFLPVMKGEGDIPFSEGGFSMSDKTVGVMRELVKFNRKIDFDGEQRRASGSARLALLGFDLNLSAEAKVIRKGVLEVKGNGRYEFLGNYLQVGLGTQVGPLLTLDLYRNAYANLEGEMSIGDFDLAGVNVNANIYRAKMKFEVLGAGLSLSVPLVDMITEKEILKLIASIFDFDPEVILDILKNPEDIKISVGPMGVGEGSGDSKSSDDTGNDYGNNGGGRESGNSGGGVETGEGSGETIPIPIEGNLPVWNPDIFDGSRPMEHRPRYITGLTPFNFSIKNTDEAANRDQLRSIWPCLPADYKKGSMVISSTATNGSFTGYDYVSPDEIGGPNGNLRGKEFFVLRVEIRVRKTTRNGKTYLCLSDEGYPRSQPNKYCVEIDERLEVSPYHPGYYANLAYSGNDIYLFLSHDLGYDKGYCQNNSQYNTPTLPFSDLKSALADIGSEILCAGCDYFDLANNEDPENIGVLKSNGQKLSGFEYRSKGTRTNRFKPFGSETSARKYFEAAGLKFKSRSIKDFENKTNISGGAILIPYKNGFIRVRKNAVLAIKKPVEGAMTHDEVIAEYNKLPALFWEKLRSQNYKDLFGTIPGYNVNGTVTSVMNQLKSNPGDLRILAPKISKYLQRWIQFGGEPDVEVVNIPNPGLRMKIWDIPGEGSSDQWRTIYTLISSTATDLRLSENLNYTLVSNDVNDYFNITGSSGIDQKRYLQNVDNSLYKNYFVHTVAGKTYGLTPFDISNNRILLARGYMDRFSFTIIKKGAYKPENRSKNQFYLHNGLTIKTDQDQKKPNLLKDSAHVRFFKRLFDTITADSTAAVHLSQFPDDDEGYMRALVIDKTNVRLIWENSNGVQSLASTKVMFSANLSKLLQPGNNARGLYGKRIVSALKSSDWSRLAHDPELAQLIFNSLDGHHIWYDKKKVRVNPLAIFRNTAIK